MGHGHTKPKDEDSASGDDNDDVEMHYEPLFVCDGVSLLTRPGGRTTVMLDEDVTGVYKKWADERVAQCIKENVCTFVRTDRVLTEQKWYPCITCIKNKKFSNTLCDAGVCEVCKELCHKGHEIGVEKMSPFVCCCGEAKCAGSTKVEDPDVLSDFKTSLGKIIKQARLERGEEVGEEEEEEGVEQVEEGEEGEEGGLASYEEEAEEGEDPDEGDDAAEDDAGEDDEEDEDPTTETKEDKVSSNRSSPPASSPKLGEVKNNEMKAKREKKKKLKKLMVSTPAQELELASQITSRTPPTTSTTPTLPQRASTSGGGAKS